MAVTTATNDGAYIHAGPGALIFDTGTKVSASGTDIAGSRVRIRPDTTALFEVGYVRRTVGLSLTVGIPPRATVLGEGTLAPLGDLGRIRYGPAAATLHYHVPGLGRFRPYFGGGPVFLIIFNDNAEALTRLKAHDHFGGAVQAGAEYAIARRIGLFLDVKKVFLKTNVDAAYGPIPLRASIRLDPAVVSGGIGFHF